MMEGFLSSLLTKPKPKICCLLLLGKLSRELKFVLIHGEYAQGLLLEVMCTEQ